MYINKLILKMYLKRSGVISQCEIKKSACIVPLTYMLITKSNAKLQPLYFALNKCPFPEPLVEGT